MPPKTRVPQLGELRTIPEVARGWKRSYWWTRRHLYRLAEQDVREHGRCKWLFHVGKSRKPYVNLQALRVAHPALFAPRWITPEEHDDLVEKLEAMHERLVAEEKARRALAARVRALETGK